MHCITSLRPDASSLYVARSFVPTASFWTVSVDRRHHSSNGQLADPMTFSQTCKYQVLSTDRFDEALMHIGWQMIDMTYVAFNVANDRHDAFNVNTKGKMTPLLVVTPERQRPTGTVGEEKRSHFGIIDWSPTRGEG